MKKMSITGRRAFASKLIKDSNVDIRHRLAKILAAASANPVVNNHPVNSVDGRLSHKPPIAHIYEDNSTNNNNHYYCDITSINDLVDPIDYEEYISKNADRLDESSRLILLFPIDDIIVEKYQPTLRTLESSGPEFNNIKISDDPYIQCIGASNLKSLIVIKKYEKKSRFLELKFERNERFKDLQRQTYEIDLIIDPKKIKSESISINESQTPKTICSLQNTLTNNTPRPQSLISSSTTRPPLALEEDYFIGDEHSHTSSTQDLNQIDCDNSSLNSFNNRISFIDSENSNNIFSLKNAQTNINGISQKNYDNFFNEFNIHYDINQNENIFPIFSLYPFQAEEEMIEFRSLVSPPSDVPRYRFLLECGPLEMNLSIEPIFASIAIYDANARKKVTENFYFDCNSESIKQSLLQPHISFQDISTLSKSAIFGLSHLNTDMYFVIKLEKVFQSDINDIFDAYARPPEDNNKLEKLNAFIKNNYQRLGRYRMLFAWAVFPLVDILFDNNQLNKENSDSLNSRNSSNSLESLKRIANEYTSSFVRKGSLERHSTISGASNYSSNTLSSNLEKKLSITSEDLIKSFSQLASVQICNKAFYRFDGDKFTDDDLYKYLAEYRRNNNNKRVRSFPCNFTFTLKNVTDENSIKCRVNPELVRLYPYTNDQISPTKEILEFRDQLIPHLEHRNLIYVYPKSLNLTSRQNSARNITIKIQLLASEEKFSAMPVIFGKSSCPEYLSEAYTAIQYHNRNPNFSEEFKIRLPSQIDKQTHLFFTFIHVHTKPKNDMPVDEIVGYSWLPLWRDDCLQFGTFSLPIIAEMPTAGYSFLSPTDSDALPNLKWIDNHKSLFVIQLDSYSSIFAQDAFVDRFFRITSSLENQIHVNSLLHSTNIYDEFCRAITGLTNSNTESLVKFVHIILNRLIMLLVKPPMIFNSVNNSSVKSFKTLVFDTIAALVDKINKVCQNNFDNIKCDILNTFIHYQAIFPQPNFNPNANNMESINNNEDNHKSFHEEVLSQWILANDTIKEKLFEHSFFYFDLIFRSLCITASLKNNSKIIHRENISKTLKNNINSLIGIIGDYIVNEFKTVSNNNVTPTTPNSPKKYPQVFQRLNSSLAFFIRDLLSILNRNYVFSLIKVYVTKLDVSKIMKNPDQCPTSSHEKFSDDLFQLKVNFLRIICGHEHFVALNLPFGTPLFTSMEQSNTNPTFSPSFSLAKEMLDSNIFSNLIFDRIRPYSELTDDYRRQHWLLGIVFGTLLESFTKRKNSLQTLTANLIRSVLTSFDWDVRLNDPSIKHRAACLFLPLIGIMIDIIEQLYDPSNKENPFYSALECRKHRKLKLHREDNLYGSSFIENSIALAIGSSINGSGGKTPNKHHIISYQQINQESTRILLACVLWTIGNVDHRLFIQYLNEFSNERLLAFLELLRITMRTFEYKGEKCIQETLTRKQSFQKLEDTIRYGTARKEMMRRRDYSQSFGPIDSKDVKYRWKRDSTCSSHYNSFRNLKKVNQEEIIFEGQLCTMANLIILDSIILIVNIFRQRIKSNSSFISAMSNQTSFNLRNKYANDEFVVGSALHALLNLFSLKQSTCVLEAAFNTQRALLYHFPELLFIEGLPDVEFCSELSYLLLKHCASPITNVRIQASASIYFLLRQYYESNDNYSRIKIQITMSLSQLVGTSSTFNEMYIRNALNNILRYAIDDNSVRETQFPNQVQELVFNLIMILSNTVQMKEHEKDPEMHLDLMYRVAKGYQNSPELRITWLENMAKRHTELAQHVEAAQCYVHAAALVSECLHKMSRRAYLPVSCAAFQKVCPNVFEESLNSNSEINIDKLNFFYSDIETKQNVQSLKLLSENGLVSLLEKAGKYFQVSGLFEAVNEVNKLLIPIHEAHYNYNELARIHQTLHDVFIKIEQQEGKRVFATYFRVGFYGSLFENLNEKEFVYKERFLTKLPEIANRLETFYGELLGHKNVEVIKDSNNVDTSKLDPNKAYIQITYVEPYFDSWELESRKTCYERSYNIRRFIYSTPFTLEGKAHGQLYEQCKRKTILTVENSFPYVKTRIQVKSRQQHCLSPIEVAIEDIQKKTNEISNATNQKPVDAKILQMVLQGCVGTTVNQGPAEIAFVFLSDEPNIPDGYQRPTLQLKDNLRNAFKEFCSRCGEALAKNSNLVNGIEQQIEYHKELERNFCRFTERLAPLMGHSNVKQSLATLRKTYLFNMSTNSSSNLTSDTNKFFNGV